MMASAVSVSIKWGKRNEEVIIYMEGDYDELYFRDYLNEYPALAAEYEALKLRLWKQYENTRIPIRKARPRL